MGERIPYEVIAVRYATQTGTKQRWYYRYPTYGEPDSPSDLDYFFWVIRGGGRTILFDTGFAEAVGARRGITRFAGPREALWRVGIDPATVSTIVLSHYHYDHIGNVRHFPDAELVVDETEHDFWRSTYGRRRPLSVSVETDDIAVIEQAVREERVSFVGEHHTVADGVEGLRLPGHTPGQQILSVTTPGGVVVLAADAAHLYEELDRDRPFSIFTDLVGMYRTYDALRDLAERKDHILVPGHDPEVMRRFRALPGESAGWGVHIGL
ncbi:N-acyl homoserine lactonase family protein [Actinacidiphila sp. ITFR-21]|uniref:N-acyl homoserine lactonase family protein n=1 Tax=Actinacidiphila sp. ITFR-21 TaxID=3075199 RepID=UPI00288B5C95|nr:N-acyl homoserine lactonase family protein [Streptomyces sp. ITFR-21]WNI18764.1 N-acyl homoserine lactonase family protein [Streptomyces sp. ITFR-21]